MTVVSASDRTRLFAERYRLFRTIGEGSTATAYLARDVRTSRPVVLKVLYASRLRHSMAVERLERAARLWQEVDHPNVVRLYDRGHAPPPFPSARAGEVHYLAMEHVAGRSLRWHVNARGPLSVAEAVGIALQVLSAVDAAHAAGLVHGDLRPQNVFLAPDGTVKVTDFGLAAAVGYSGPHYLSPEQAQGRAATPASDLYALGVILYEMLADSVPFDSLVPESVLLKHVSEPPVPPTRLRPSLPRGLENPILRALAKASDDRWPSAAAFAAALSPFEDASDGAAGRRASWGHMLAAREQDLAPVSSRDMGALGERRIRPRTYAGLAALAVALLVVLAYASGWRVRVTVPGPAAPAQEVAERLPQPAPTPDRVPVTPTGAPATVPADNRVAAFPVAPTPPGGCQAPGHHNPAIAEAYRTLVEDTCDTPLWEAVGEVVRVAVARKVEVRFGQPGGSTYGLFDPARNEVVLAQAVSNEAPRTRAALLLHEFTHAKDYYAGGLSWGDDVLACYDIEYRAFRLQASYWSISQAKRGNPKASSPLEADLEYVSQAIERGSADFIARDLVARYGSSCKR